MKSTLMFAMMVAASLTSAASARADEVGQVRQGLGEQCSILSTIYKQSDGCGATDDYIQMSISAEIQAYKHYRVEVFVADSGDNQTLVFSQTLTGGSQNDFYTPEDIYADVTRGRYQAHLVVTNPDTGTVVCTAASSVVQSVN